MLQSQRHESIPLPELEGVDGVKSDKHNGSGWQVSTPLGYSDNFDPLLTIQGWGGGGGRRWASSKRSKENRDREKKNVRTHKTNKGVLTAGDERR